VKRICIFCGAATGGNPAFARAARTLGVTTARHGLAVVYGAGNIGLMGVLADAALDAKGGVIGVIPQSLVDRELAHRGLTKLHVVHSMHERKALMADLSDAFVALPGGYGTLEEFCEVLTWAQLGFHSKPCGLLNTEGFYDAFLGHLDKAVACGFILPQHRALVVADSDPERLLEKVMAARPSVQPKFLNRDEI
jgi:uncharacterized protein (TIGR00730 family)